jgi:hypothetical protein
MAEAIPKVMVYQYETWDPSRRQHRKSERFATIDKIRSGLGTSIYATATWVPVAEVVDGFYKPGPTRAQEAQG